MSKKRKQVPLVFSYVLSQAKKTKEPIQVPEEEIDLFGWANDNEPLSQEEYQGFIDIINEDIRQQLAMEKEWESRRQQEIHDEISFEKACDTIVEHVDNNVYIAS